VSVLKRVGGRVSFKNITVCFRSCLFPGIDFRLSVSA